MFTDPALLTFAQQIVKHRLFTHVQFQGVKALNAFVEDEPVFVELSDVGFRRVDFTCESPLGDDPIEAARVFLQGIEAREAELAAQ